MEPNRTPFLKDSALYKALLGLNVGLGEGSKESCIPLYIYIYIYIY